ncbi:MAG: hypothetical protein FJZ47_17490 [Candidatus Tectomicrobia bacterium]|uniref:Uncharacterized protein n=1 Tax=Tectimicrobiota bacterium TaxID=2528274 RepID=A0A937W294_UNCTE|nr:hypothetical protein [Candidatus Tectomicrobia bacterium]
MPTITCMGRSEAHGRNRWFRLAEMVLTLYHQSHTDEARLGLDCYSRRRGRSAPVILSLTLTDALALTQALQEAMQPLGVAPPPAIPGCPQCQEAQHLAYTTPTIEGTLVVQEALCHTCGACWHDVYAYSNSVLDTR